MKYMLTEGGYYHRTRVIEMPPEFDPSRDSFYDWYDDDEAVVVSDDTDFEANVTDYERVN